MSARLRMGLVVLGAAWLAWGCGDDSGSTGDSDAGGASGSGGAGGSGDEVECEPDQGTFQGIQRVVFDGYGCTNGACHGNQASPAGGLDLRPEVAYQNLIRVQAQADLTEPLQLVYPGEQRFSFLFHKLDAATNGTALPAGGGTPMPNGTAALTAEHLEAMRLWIRSGAPETGVVLGANELLDCGLSTEPTPNKIAQPDAPPLGEGFQLLSGPWTVQPESEDEVCFATYYDLSKVDGLLPEAAKIACQGNLANYTAECFAYKASELTQDAQSHHSLIYAYAGATDPKDPVWGDWTCKKGAHAGMACDPIRIGESVMDGGADCGEGAVCATNAQSVIGCRGWGAPDSDTARAGMGGAQSPVARREQYEGVYGQLPVRAVVIWNSHGFNLTDEATDIEQYLNYTYAGPDEREYLVRSIFQTKDIFVQEVPPFEARTYCASETLPRGAHVTNINSHVHKRGVLWNTWLPPNDPGCQTTSGCEPEPESRKPDYVSKAYNDPNYMYFDPPLVFDSDNVEDRTFKYCVTYDNGSPEYPELLKRNSTSVGSKCDGAAYCVGGDKQGERCGSDQSVCTGGGSCDACPVSGGFTTEDEMLIFQGAYYVVE